MSGKRAAYGNFFRHDMGAKHAGLMQDYVILQQEHAAVEDRLQAAKMRKATLLAEVRFLRRRLKKLKETPSDLKEKETSFAIPQSQLLVSCNGKTDPQTRIEEPSNFSAKNTSVPVFWEPLLKNGCVEFPKPISDNMGLVSVLKTSTYRNRPNSFAGATVEKKKISWHDQISLECN